MCIHTEAPGVLGWHLLYPCLTLHPLSFNASAVAYLCIWVWVNVQPAPQSRKSETTFGAAPLRDCRRLPALPESYCCMDAPPAPLSCSPNIASDAVNVVSTAGTEASGTGCMKFMMNGALTIGTFDGANIEIAESVGNDNIFIFGLNVEDINKIKAGGYNPQEYIERSPILKEIMQLIKSNFFSPVDYNLFGPIVENLIFSDPYFLCADFEAYCATQDKISALYRDKNSWTKKSILNVAKSGKFSSDRTIKEYASQIWNVPA